MRTSFKSTLVELLKEIVFNVDPYSVCLDRIDLYPYYSSRPIALPDTSTQLLQSGYDKLLEIINHHDIMKRCLISLILMVMLLATIFIIAPINCQAGIILVVLISGFLLQNIFSPIYFDLMDIQLIMPEFYNGMAMQCGSKFTPFVLKNALLFRLDDENKDLSDQQIIDVVAKDAGAGISLSILPDD